MEERRLYKRLPVAYHANGFDCGLELEGRLYLAELVNVSRGGARIRLSQAAEYNLLGLYGIVRDDNYEKPYLKGSGYTVAWHEDNEVGLCFRVPLAVPTEYLDGYYATNI